MPSKPSKIIYIAIDADGMWRLVDDPGQASILKVIYDDASIDFFVPNALPVEQKGLELDRDGLKALTNARLEIFNRDVEALAQKVYTGDITIGQWEESMRRLDRELHASILAIHKGGWDNVTQSDWGTLGNRMKKQYKYLHGFAETIAADSDTIALGTIQARARMYGQAAVGDAYVASTPIDVAQQLPWMPKDGSTKCLVNCKCVWVLSTVTGKRNKTVTATWRMTPAEHCDDCLKRSGYKVTFTVPLSTNVPVYVGGY